ncbi:MAG: bifunctional diaminohydroxyphosphoribosylaminopyrimidine deaminase/5-amino-6-(5-phosphoribosylamino)uracil reductase RibD [Planctomycetota bacterium]
MSEEAHVRNGNAGDGEARFMERALRLARRGLGAVSPNPPVGAVAVCGGVVIGEGWHRRFGGPHAEADLVARLSAGAGRGADLYVTLEPCAHFGKTPPCTVAIREAGFARVFYAVADPHPVTRGKGPKELRRAGVQVARGLLEEPVRFLLAPYLKGVLCGLPLVTAKWAMSFDGRVATRSGDARWISDDRARAYTRRERSTYDAILVGRGTVALDDPDLTTRTPRRRNPTRVVLDSRARLSPQCRLLLSARETPVWVFVSARALASQAAVARRARGLERCGARVFPIPAGVDGLDLPATLAELGRQGVRHLLVEGGPTVQGSFFDGGLIDRVQVVVGPRLIGGADAPGPVGGVGHLRMAGAPVFDGFTVKRVGESLVLSGVLTPAGYGHPAP